MQVLPAILLVPVPPPPKQVSLTSISSAAGAHFAPCSCDRWKSLWKLRTTSSCSTACTFPAYSFMLPGWCANSKSPRSTEGRFSARPGTCGFRDERVSGSLDGPWRRITVPTRAKLAKLLHHHRDKCHPLPLPASPSTPSPSSLTRSDRNLCPDLVISLLSMSYRRISCSCCSSSIHRRLAS